MCRLIWNWALSPPYTIRRTGEVGCASGFGGGTVDDKVGEGTRDMLGRAHLSQRRLRGDKVTGR